LRLFRILGASPLPLCVAELADILRRPQYAVSRGLAELRKAGLVAEDRRGKLVYYALASEPGVGDLAQWAQANCWCSEAENCGYDLDRLRWRLELREGGRLITYRGTELGGLESGGVGEKSPQKKRVLFICVHNSARSQLAEAFLNLHGGGAWQAQSAGLETGYLNPYVVDYLEERGIGIRGKTPRSVFEVYRSGATFDWVVTVCDPAVEASCPVFPGPVARQTWPFP